MKKTYMKPTMHVKRLAVQQIICVSSPSAAIDTTSTINADELDTRRSISIWDDNDDE